MKAPSHERVELFGVPVDNLTMAETLDRIGEMIRAGGTHQHVVVNVDKIVKLQSDPQLRQAILGCDLINADGQPVVWASRILGCPLKERVTGIDLFAGLVQRCAERGWRPYFLGAQQEVVAKLVELFKAKYPQLDVAGWRNGYWTDAEEPAVVAGVKEARPQILFVAMSSPRKEMFLSRWRNELQIPFVMGVGGSFDVLAGVTKRAPGWMQRGGLEWLFRLAQEPKRLWRRYLIEDMRFLGLLAREWWRR